MTSPVARICRVGVLASVALAAWLGTTSLADAPNRAAPASAPTGAAPDSPFAGGLVGSKHDFTAGDRAPRDLCLPCHTPHITAQQAELLTHGSARGREGDHEVIYSDSSLLCLSCHDGITAPDVYATSHAGVWPSDRGPAPASAIRPNRLTSHPVGIRYPTGDSKYVPAAGVMADGQLRLPDGRIQCITCHDPHNTDRHPGMLVTSNHGSRLCLSCHQL